VANFSLSFPVEVISSPYGINRAPLARFVPSLSVNAALFAFIINCPANQMSGIRDVKPELPCA
jgi:hypothetical protein